MPLLPATRLGPYEVISAIGAGGMGEVYRAKDTRLDRIVAIKIIPEHLSANPQVRERFEREAHAIASLSHPHICTLHDVGHQDGIDFLVMEYLEGETLAHKLLKGPLPIDQVLQHAIQIADGLDTAHRHGIIHRDLKPGNIMLTKSGVKVLDFGLAKMRTAGAVTGGTALPTQTTPLTGEGSILGTLQYMAPEQLEGKDADARTDIFALGTVIYEMATGRKAFEGNSQASLIAAIITSEPLPLSKNADIIPILDRVVRKCICKDATRRWQSASDLRDELQWISESGLVLPRAKATRRHERLAWSLVTAFLAAVMVVVSTYLWPRPSEGELIRFDIAPPDKAEVVGYPVVSPDGRRVAIPAIVDGHAQLWIRDLKSMNLRLLSGTEGVGDAFWSPDSRSIGFFAERALKRIDANGGAARVLCQARDPLGGSWSRDGNIIFAPVWDSPLYSVSASGGKPVQITTLDHARGEQAHKWPVFLPDGRHFLFCAGKSVGRSHDIKVGSVDSTGSQFLLSAGSNVEYSSHGGKAYLMYAQEGILLAQPFNAKRLQLSGDPIKVFGDESDALHRPAFSLSQNGVLAFMLRPHYLRQLRWFDRHGKPLGATGGPADYWSHELSPDGTRVAMEIVSSETGNGQIWIHDIPRRVTSRFSFSAGWDYTSVWAPDGSWVAFTRYLPRPSPPTMVVKKPAIGGDEQILLTTDPNEAFLTDVAPDGRVLLFEAPASDASLDLWLLPLTGGRRPRPIIQNGFLNGQGRFSPNGRWLAYTSNESGRAEVYVRPMTENYSAGAAKWMISSSGGHHPHWRRDNRELYYIAPDNNLMAASVNPGSTFSSSVPLPLFKFLDSAIERSRNIYSVSPDGQQFLVNVPANIGPRAPIHVLLNWTAWLKQ